MDRTARQAAIHGNTKELKMTVRLCNKKWERYPSKIKERNCDNLEELSTQIIEHLSIFLLHISNQNWILFIMNFECGLFKKSQNSNQLILKKKDSAPDQQSNVHFGF